MVVGSTAAQHSGSSDLLDSPVSEQGQRVGGGLPVTSRDVGGPGSEGRRSGSGRDVLKTTAKHLAAKGHSS